MLCDPILAYHWYRMIETEIQIYDAVCQRSEISIIAKTILGNQSCALLSVHVFWARPPYPWTPMQPTQATTYKCELRDSNIIIFLLGAVFSPSFIRQPLEPYDILDTTLRK